ncbi:hypothetical protein DIJ64_12895 [Mycobacterium leprae]|uniref:Uncharacterized protein n=1 Tax=Mycobacterium leprae TaxID=1769 RepID=A0AAD0P5H2_MYCLR|nr:hypothetical protein DIJ64_12895 [Mycobacterium leprae]OAR21111.1 hypothetical protein A8144_01190 [Mycobacterium leprae 3125609]OAX72109.1 hypothetical protein A3216_01265 [Mycobacterium leprae 7935681]
MFSGNVFQPLLVGMRLRCVKVKQQETVDFSIKSPRHHGIADFDSEHCGEKLDFRAEWIAAVVSAGSVLFDVDCDVDMWMWICGCI